MSKMSQILSKLSALAGSIDMSHAAGTVAMTMISGVGRGEFKTPIRYLGSVCYLVLEVSPITCQLVIRGYSAGIRNYAHEVLIGSHQFNTIAHDPTGRSRLRFPESDAVGLAASRMLPYMAGGQSVVSDDDVGLPNILAQVDQEVLQKGVNSQKLQLLGQELRKRASEQTRFYVPANGRVVMLKYAENHDHMYVVVETEAGAQHEVLVPTRATLNFAVAEGMPAPEVKLGQSLVKNLHQVSDFVCEDFAWMSLIQNVTLPNGEQADVVPFEYLAEAIRQKRVQARAIYEDVSALLGPPIENPAAIVLAGIEDPKKIQEAAGSIRTQALSRFRRELGDHAVFATDEDLLCGLQCAGDPLHLSGMAIIQHWNISHERSMLLTRPDCFADFQGMRPSWRRLLRNPDLEPVLQDVLTQADETGLLNGPKGAYAEATLQLLRQYPTLCSQTIAKVGGMLDDQVEATQVRDYLVTLRDRVREADAQPEEEGYDDKRHPATMSGTAVSQTV